MSAKIAMLLLGLVSAGLSSFMAIYAYSRRANSPAARSFAGMMAANALYAIFYTIELQMPTKELAILLIKCEYMAVVAIPVFWTVFANSFSNRGRGTSPLAIAFLSAIPVITAVLMWTNEFHGLMFAQLNRDTTSPLMTFTHNVRGPWFSISTGYLYILLAVGSVRLLYYLSTTSGDFRDQTGIIVAGVLLPWLGHIAQVVHASPWNLDLAPFASAISGCFLTLGIFKLRLFDLVPIAREKIVDAIQEGVIVLDNSDRIVDHNRMAGELFPILETLAPGTDFPAFLAHEGLTIVETGREQAFSLHVRGELRHFRLLSTPVQDGRGNPLGRALILNDISEIVELMERLKQDGPTGARGRRETRYPSPDAQASGSS